MTDKIFQVTGPPWRRLPPLITPKVEALEPPLEPVVITTPIPSCSLVLHPRGVGRNRPPQFKTNKLKL